MITQCNYCTTGWLCDFKIREVFDDTLTLSCECDSCGQSHLVLSKIIDIV